MKPLSLNSLTKLPTKLPAKLPCKLPTQATAQDSETMGKLIEYCKIPRTREEIQRFLSNKLCVAPLVDELSRTPSNQTTRRLFIETLKILMSKNNDAMIEKSLTSLLSSRNFAPKMKEHIIDTMYNRH